MNNTKLNELVSILEDNPYILLTDKGALLQGEKCPAFIFDEPISFTFKDNRLKLNFNNKTYHFNSLDYFKKRLKTFINQTLHVNEVFYNLAPPILKLRNVLLSDLPNEKYFNKDLLIEDFARVLLNSSGEDLFTYMSSISDFQLIYENGRFVGVKHPTMSNTELKLKETSP